MSEMHEEFRVEPARVPCMAIWYEDATAAARALGVDIDLPDLGGADQEFWNSFDCDAWRNSLKGRVEMSPEEIDEGPRDWVLLKRFPFEIELWFDMENGIVFMFPAASARSLAEIVRNAATGAGLRLSERWPGNLVVMLRAAGYGMPSQETMEALFKKAGYRWDDRWWILPTSP